MTVAEVTVTAGTVLGGDVAGARAGATNALAARSLIGGDVGGTTCAAIRPPALTAAAPVTAWTPTARARPVAPARANNGTSANQAIGPPLQRNFPTEISKKALTI